MVSAIDPPETVTGTTRPARKKVCSVIANSRIPTNSSQPYRQPLEREPGTTWRRVADAGGMIKRYST